MPDHVERRTGTYVDSVSLMQVSRAAASAPGVDAAQVAMATELNLDVIRGMGFDVPERVAQRPARRRPRQRRGHRGGPRRASPRS